MKQCRLFALFLTAALCLAGCQARDYQRAGALYDQGDFAQAREIYQSLGDYEDSPSQVTACRYYEAAALYYAGDYEAARLAFAAIQDFHNSASMVRACIYGQALDCYEAGEYENTMAILEQIPGYPNADTLSNQALRDLRYQRYPQLMAAVDGGVWYAGGGARTVLNRISLDYRQAQITQVYFDGNGVHTQGTYCYPYEVTDDALLVALPYGEVLTIAYTLTGSELTLGQGEYRTAEQVEQDLQGAWTCRLGSDDLGFWSESEHNLLIRDGMLTYEHAALGLNLPQGQYYYYGPHQDSFTLGLGVLECENQFIATRWYFTIQDGRAVPLYYDHACSPAEGLPGEDGYKFQGGIL